MKCSKCGCTNIEGNLKTEGEVINLISAAIYLSKGFEVHDSIDLSDATNPDEQYLYELSCTIFDHLINQDALFIKGEH